MKSLPRWSHRSRLWQGKRTASLGCLPLIYSTSSSPLFTWQPTGMPPCLKNRSERCKKTMFWMEYKYINHFQKLHIFNFSVPFIQFNPNCFLFYTVGQVKFFAFTYQARGFIQALLWNEHLPWATEKTWETQPRRGQPSSPTAAEAGTQVSRIKLNHFQSRYSTGRLHSHFCPCWPGWWSKHWIPASWSAWSRPQSRSTSDGCAIICNVGICFSGTSTFKSSRLLPYLQSRQV